MYFRDYHLGKAAHFDLPLYLHMLPLAYDSYPTCTAGVTHAVGLDDHYKSLPTELLYSMWSSDDNAP